MDYKSSIASLITIDGVSVEEIKELITLAKDSNLADYAFPCFKYAKALSRAPQMIASDIVAAIDKPSFIESIEAVNGYVNFKLSRLQYVTDVTMRAISQGSSYGTAQIGSGKCVCIDYSSINIAKPFHMGHLSATVIGAALYRLYKALGYNVMGINHLGDWGTQFGKLIYAFKEWGNRDDINKRGVRALFEIYVKYHKEAEKDSKLDDMARKYFKDIENGDQSALELFYWFKEITLKDVSKIYDRLHVNFDSYNGEAFYNDKMEPVLAEIAAKGLSTMSQGAMIVEFDGDEMPPCLLKKNDGATLYATRDLAAAFYRKNNYDFYKCLYVVAYQQNLHFKQLFKVIEMMGYEWSADMVHVPFGMVSIEDGKLSTRDGNVVFVEDVLNKATEKALEVINDKNSSLEDKENVAEMVGVGAVVFGVLGNNRIKDVVFSYDKVLNFDGETGPYVQYTYARGRSVLAKAKYSECVAADYTTLTSCESYELIKLIDKYPEILIEAAERYEPSMVARHILSIAAQFNKFYLEQNIINSSSNERQARLQLVKVTTDIIESAMALMGVSCPQSM